MKHSRFPRRRLSRGAKAEDQRGVPTEWREAAVSQARHDDPLRPWLQANGVRTGVLGLRLHACEYAWFGPAFSGGTW